MWVILILLVTGLAQAQQNWQYATYVGGMGDDYVRLVTSDDHGNTFIAGQTASIGAPFSEEPSGYRSGSRAYLMKLDPKGALIFSKVLGDGGVGALAVDSEGNVILAGAGLPIMDIATPGSFQPNADGFGAFLVKFGPAGEKLAGTYFGFRGSVQIMTLSVDNGGRPIFCGWAAENAVPLTSSTLFQPSSSLPSMFCAQLNADFSQLLFSSLLGTSGGYVYPRASTLDSNGDLIVVGGSFASNFPLVNAFQTEDRRRSLYRPLEDGSYQSRGDAAFGTVASVQRVGQQVFVGSNDSGAWVSPDGGDTWNHLPGSPLGALTAHPLNTRLLCAVTLATQVHCSIDGGSTWQPTIVSGISDIVADPWVEGAFFLISRTTIAGPTNYLSLRNITARINFPGHVGSLSIDPAGNRIYAVSIELRTLYVSTDHGATFNKLSGNVLMVAAAPGAPRRLYAIRSVVESKNDGLVIRSDDGGATWTDTTWTFARSEPFYFVQQLIVDPSDPDIVFVVQLNGTFRSADAGRTWQPWMPQGLDNLSVRTISFDTDGAPWVGTLGTGNGFLMKLGVAEPAIHFSTLFGGAGGGQFSAIQLDEQGRILVSGLSYGFDLPATGADLGPRQATGGFLARFDTAGRLEALRYLGVTPAGLDRSPDGALHLAATTNPSHLPVVEKENGQFAGGGADAVWLTVAPDLSRVLQATWFGGSAAETAWSTHLGRDGRIRLVGSTLSRDLPVSPDALQSQFAQAASFSVGGDGFLAIAPLLF